MASALVNNVGLMAADGFLDLPPSAAAISCGWLSPRISFSRDFSDDDNPPLPAAPRSPEKPASAAARSSLFPPPEGKAADEADLGGSPGRDLATDFEFLRVGDPATMLPADELFSDGKLVPLQISSARSPPPARAPASSAGEALSPEPRGLRRKAEASGSEPCAFSPRAPRCSSRWRELLGLKRAAQNGGGVAAKLDAQRSSSSAAVAASLRSPSARSLKRFLHRNRRSCSIDSSLRLPLLRDADSESVTVCSRLSLSSSSSGPDHEDHPRVSLDSDKPSRVSISLGRNPPRVRLAPRSGSGVDPSPGPLPHHHSTPAASGAAGVAAGGRIGSSPMQRVPEDAVAVPARSASVESPRMNSSGKVVFHGLERSSSSPSTFNGGARVKQHRGMERSYSANVVRVTPVLNVPVCSLRGSSRAGSVFGFGQLFSSPQKKDSATGLSSSGAARNGGVAARSIRTERP